MSDNVIPFGISLEIKERQTACFCKSFVFDLHARIVSCSNCGKVFEAFDALVEVSKHMRLYQRQLKELKTEIVKKKEQLSRINKDIQNAKGRLYRAERGAS